MSVRKLNQKSVRILAITALSTLTGCSIFATPRPSVTKDDKKSEVYNVAFRQVPPQPVYNRLRFVHLPEMVPSRELPSSNAGIMEPVVHLELKNATLEEASAVLAAISRYSSYCASGIATDKITINSLGTLDELAGEISNKAKIRVVIDHPNRQVRFLSGQSVETIMNSDPSAPKFSDEPGSQG